MIFSNHGVMNLVMPTFVFYWKNKFQTKQNKALRNRTALVIHASVPRFPGVCGLLASDIRYWINRVKLHGACACVKLWVRIGCGQIAVYRLKFIFLNNCEHLHCTSPFNLKPFVVQNQQVIWKRGGITDPNEIYSLSLRGHDFSVHACSWLAFQRLPFKIPYSFQYPLMPL